MVGTAWTRAESRVRHGQSMRWRRASTTAS